MHEEESREEMVYDGRYDDQNLNTALHMTEQVELACAKFFAFVPSCDRVDYNYTQEVHHDSLWWYFDTWLMHLCNSDFRRHPTIWLGPDGDELTFGQFRNLIPAIYLKIATEYLRNPSRLDFIRTGSWRHGRLRTRVGIQLVWLLFTLTGDPWDRLPRLHTYLHDKIAIEGYPGRIPRRVTSLLPPFGTRDDDMGMNAWGRSGITPTAQEIEHGEIFTLICGALSHWPVRTYDSEWYEIIC